MKFRSVAYALHMALSAHLSNFMMVLPSLVQVATPKPALMEKVKLSVFK